MTTKNTLTAALLGLVVSLGLASCEIDNDGFEINNGPIHEVELIVFGGPNTTSSYSAFRNGSEIELETSGFPVSLMADTAYQVSVNTLDEEGNEVRDLGTDYQIFWFDSSTVQYEDWIDDANDNPTGRFGQLTTGAPNEGTLTLVYIRGLDKFAEEVSDGDTTNAGGEIVFIATYDLLIE